MPTKTGHWAECWKCQGTGQYQNFGVCFACHGRKRLWTIVETADWRVDYISYSSLTFKLFDTRVQAWAFLCGPHGKNNLCTVFHLDKQVYVQDNRSEQTKAQHAEQL